MVLATTQVIENAEAKANEDCEAWTQTRERTCLLSRSQLSSLRASHDMQRMRRSMEQLDRTVSSVQVSAHDADQLSEFVHNVAYRAKYFSWDLERKQSGIEQLPLLQHNYCGASGFQIRRAFDSPADDRFPVDAHLSSRTTEQLNPIVEDVEEGGVGDRNFAGSSPTAHRHCLVLNRYGRLRVQSKLQPLRNLVGDTSESNDDDWWKTARDSFQVIDTNSDGFLSRQEVLRAIKLMTEMNNDFAMNVDPTSEELTNRLLHRTADEDDELDLNEFILLVETEIRSGRNVVRDKLAKASKFIYDLLLNERQNQAVSRDDHSWIIHPKSALYLFWNFFVTVASIGLVFFLPISFGWQDWPLVYEWNYFFEVIFGLDLILNLCTGFIKEDGVIVLDFTEAFKHYLRHAFVVDAVSSIPAQLIITSCGIMKGQYLLGRTGLKAFKMLRLAKLFYLRRTDPLYTLTKNSSMFLETTIGFNMPVVLIKLLRLVFLTFVLSHWMGSLQWTLVRLEDFPEDSWAVYAGLESESHRTQWRYSIFKALCQLILIGFESPPFTNTSCETLSDWCQKEHWVTLLCLYIGAVYYSFLISSMLAIIQANNRPNAAYQEQLSLLNDYLKHKKVSVEVRREIREDFRMNNPSRVYFDETEVAKSMSIQGIEAVRRHCTGDIARLVPILADPDNKAFTHCVTGYLSQVKIDTGQVLFNEDEIGDAMYFLQVGRIRLSACFLEEQGEGEGILVDGCFFGEVSLLSENALRTMTATADTACTLFRLEKHHFELLLTLFPDVADRIVKVAGRRLQVLMNFKDEENLLPAGCGVRADLSTYYDTEDKKIPFVQSKVPDDDKDNAPLSEDNGDPSIASV